MADTPLFTKLDADRILQRAAEIEGTEDSRPLTLGELRGIAGEAGFGTSAVERAIAEALQTGPTGAERTPVDRAGWIFTRLSTIRTVPFELSSEQLLRAVKLAVPYRDGPAQIVLNEHSITWKDRKGLHFKVVSRQGRTEVQVRVRKPLLRKGRWMGWVKAAADRVEAMLFIAAAREGVGVPLLESENGRQKG